MNTKLGMPFLEFELLKKKMVPPSRATLESACLDVGFNFPDDSRLVKMYDEYNCVSEIDIPSTINELNIPPHWRIMVPTALKLKIHGDWHVKVYNRSSVSLKKGLFLVNSVGIIDSDFNDELKILLYNGTDVDVHITEGERVAQIMAVPCFFNMWMPEEFRNSLGFERKGGFGSTGL